jgi:hypothetical protein
MPPLNGYRGKWRRYCLRKDSANFILSVIGSSGLIT